MRSEREAEAVGILALSLCQTQMPCAAAVAKCIRANRKKRQATYASMTAGGRPKNSWRRKSDEEALS